MTTNNKTYKMSIYLHKVDVDSFDDCLKKKARENSKSHMVKQDIGISGKIYIHESSINIPEWKDTLQKLTNESIEVNANSSNKAVVIFKYKGRFISVVYGYGRSMIEDSTIERNFGLIVAANLIDPKKLRSLNSMTIEDTIVDIQKQTISYSDQDNFHTDKNREILKSLSGSPNLESTAKFLVGNDSLIATRKMEIENIKESIQFYFDAYKKEDYLVNGFGWLNNIKRVKDSSLITDLNLNLQQTINGGSSEILIAPNKILDWQNIIGFYITGIGKVSEEEISIDLNYEEYFRLVRSKTNINILDKLKRDKIYAVTEKDSEFIISNVYEGITFETIVDDNRYLLSYGDWYEIEEGFYKEINKKVSSIPICDIQFSPCINNMSESEYNEKIADEGLDYASLDKRNYSIPGYGRSRIEPCDILTKDKKLIHVKKGGSSSKLSHLFAQGVVSARLLSTDNGMKEHINSIVEDTFGKDFIKDSDKNSDFEIVYAIIDSRDKEISKLLPFFSLVNLGQAIDQLDAMNYKFSFMKIEVNKE